MSTRPEGPHEPLTDPETWLANYGDFLFRYARLRVQTREVAEDLVQETLLAALRSKEKFQARASERTWLLGILKHKIVDYIRKASRERLVANGLSPEDGSEDLFDGNGQWAVEPSRWEDPRKVLEKKQFWERFMGCLGELPGRMAHAFALRELEELDGEEVARVLEVTPNNLGVLLYRARQRLRRCLEMQWFE